MKDKELRRREDLKEGGKLLKRRPKLKPEEELRWKEEGAGEKLRMLCELLKGNAIPTKSLNLVGDEKEE